MATAQCEGRRITFIVETLGTGRKVTVTGIARRTRLGVERYHPDDDALQVSMTADDVISYEVHIDEGTG